MLILGCEYEYSSVWQLRNGNKMIDERSQLTYFVNQIIFLFVISVRSFDLDIREPYGPWSIPNSS